MKNLTRKKIARAFVSYVANHPKQDAVARLAATIIHAGMTQEIDFILNDIAAEMYRQNGELEATVTSAHPLSKVTLDEIKDWLGQTMDAKTINVHTCVDASVLGGVIIKTPYFEQDVSLNHLLERLETV